MQVCRNIEEIRTAVRAFHKDDARVGFVPTMGALHDGHLTLVQAARDSCDRVVASIFVNPTQFGEAEDLAKYPRTEAADLALLESKGVDAVFLPAVTEMYPEGTQTVVEVTDLSRVLVGKVRPGHFRGVTTVVTKLFNIVQPDAAFFGEKDYQQLRIIRQMVRDLDMPVDITGVPIVREPDGLAMSSRNVRLRPDHRAQSVVLNRALDWAAQQAATGPVTIAELDTGIRQVLAEAADGTVEAVDIQHADTLADLSGRLATPAVIMLAVRFGPVLLIDARVVTPA